MTIEYRYATYAEVTEAIVKVIESGGLGTAANFDIDAIADETIRWADGAYVVTVHDDF